MTENKQKTFDGKFINTKDVKVGVKKEKCLYCGEKLTVIDGRHLSHCEKYQEYKEKIKKTQSSIVNFFQPIVRRSYPIERIVPNSWNVNVMSHDDFEALKESIQKTKGEFLKNNPIQIRELEKDKYEIIDGEHRWRACKDLKYTHIPATVENNVDVEKAKTMTVLYSKNRGKVDHFKFSKLLNEEYWKDIKEAEETNWKKRRENVNCTYSVLANRFGESESRIKHIILVYQKLKNIYKSASSHFFSKDHFEALASCKDDFLREKLFDQSIKNEWTAEKIRKQVTKLNKISKYLLNEIKHDSVRECILKLFTGTSIFELSYEKLVEKIFNLFIENKRKDVIIKYFREFEIKSRIARDHRTEYAEKHNRDWKGWYVDSYTHSPKYTDGSKMAWDFFQEFYHGNVNCFYCNKKILLFKDFIAHHEPYEYDYLWFIFLDLDQKIFPCCNKCHQPGNSRNWKSQSK